MDVPSIEGSNTLSLITWLLGLSGATFAQKCGNALEILRVRMSTSENESDEWKRLLRAKGQIEGFIRHDRERPFDWKIACDFAAAA